MSNSQSTKSKQRNLAILQYNLTKNSETTHGLLNDPSSAKYALLLLQEQYWDSKYTKSSSTHQTWTLIEPKRNDTTQPRAVIYANNRILSTSAYESIAFPTSDIAAIIIKQDDTSTLIINIYNTKGSPLISTLETYLYQHLRNNNYDKIIIAEDFNLHHSA